MWLFRNVVTASVWGAQLSALVNMFGSRAAAEQYKCSEKHLIYTLKLYLLKVNMKCKEEYYLNMQIVLLIYQF